MASVTKSAGTGTVVTVSPYDDRNWDNPGNIGESDNIYAITALNVTPSNPYTRILTATNFGFTVPADATIKGIEVSVEAKAAISIYAYSFVSLTKDGVNFVGNNLSDGSRLQLVDNIKTFGSSAELWGVLPLASEINSANFGVGIAFTYAETTEYYNKISVDHVQITIHYTEGLFPSSILSAEAFGTPTISPGGVNLSPSGIASAEALGTAALSPGAVNVSPAGIATAEAFGNPTIGTGKIGAVGIASAEEFGTAAVVPGEVNISLAGNIESRELFGLPTVKPEASYISAFGIPSGEYVAIPRVREQWEKSIAKATAWKVARKPESVINWSSEAIPQGAWAETTKDADTDWQTVKQTSQKWR